MYTNQMKKKIIFYMPSFEGGGVEKNIIMIANYFISKKTNISLITTSNKIKSKFHKKVNIITPKSKFWDNKKRFFKYFVSLILLSKEYLKNKNFKVFCFQGNIGCIIICKILQIDIIIRPNSSPSGWSGNNLKIKLFSKVFTLANKIVVNSYAFKKELKNKFNLNSKCIYNPLNVNQINQLSKKKIKFNFFKKDSFNLISVGRLAEQKDHITTLKAVNNIKNKINLRLLIIGDGGQKNNLLNYINKNKLNNIVKLQKRIDNPFPFILKSDAVVLASKFEGLPNILLEALALKKFIISSDCPTGPSEILDRGKGGILFKVGNFLELSKKIIFLKKNYKYCLNKKKYAYSRISRFDYKKNLENYYNLFK
jgi:N-acetylgalactosamine-N,N'-diacetylbacillosaminyl-diphospho-undecaprenol 4-alpha-N-acetylgalactosaminyltransferase